MASTATEAKSLERRMSASRLTSIIFVAIAAACFAIGDIEVSTLDPWTEFGRMLTGIFTPDFTSTDRLLEALLHTVAFALLGVAFGNVFGFALSLVFEFTVVRIFCAVVRSVHELFWALIFLQVLGLTPWTGILAIGIPYAGIIAKVYAEILEEADPRPQQALASGTGRVSAFLFTRLPDSFAHFRTYSLYRLECGLRSSAVLGFVGLPTLGFHLESAFAQGHYSEVSALLILFYIVIATIRQWLRQALIPLYLVAAVWVLPQGLPIPWSAAWTFFTHDILPHPLRVADDLGGATWLAIWEWFVVLMREQALPGVANTLVLTMIALVGSGILTLLMFPLISPLLLGPMARRIGHVTLVVIRSTPEYILAYVGLQLWGPSMLPAIVALSVHNGGIIGHLIGRYTETLTPRMPELRRSDRYFYEILPQIYPQFLAFLFYRWEVILRETAILGMLGIQTLGFFVDSAFADIRFDKAIVLIGVTALLNIAVDAVSRAIRTKLRLRTSFDHV
jgi:phosphonate transport system permease protein